MLWTIVGASEQGERNEQEDNFIILPSGDKNNLKENEYLLVVADGMGGQEHGKLASDMLIKIASQIWETEQINPTLVPDLLNKIITQAHDNIQKLREQFQSNMGTTAVILYVRGMQAWWVHVGDSRLYHIRGNKVLTQTIDHSVVQMLFAMGRISATEIPHHADRGLLLKNLGSSSPIEPEYGYAKLRQGDSFVLCTDGFWENMPISSVISSLNKYPITKIAKVLANRAVKKAGEKSDNTTLIVAKSHPKKMSILDYVLLFLLILFILNLIVIKLL
jgi:PPM family protein phosphatase